MKPSDQSPCRHSSTTNPSSDEEAVHRLLRLVARSVVRRLARQQGLISDDSPTPSRRPTPSAGNPGSDA